VLAEPVQDQRAEWLLERRYGSDPERRKDFLDFLIPVRERVLRRADVKDGEILLDVGAGDGLIAFGALDLLGKQGRVILSDISQDLLNYTQNLARQMDVMDRCSFLCASAEDLGALEDASVDVVTTRSVLIYVRDKKQAFDEFYRVLRPGGRLSIFEPINNFAYPEPSHHFHGYDVMAVTDLADRVKAAYGLMQPLDDEPMLNFNERDLLAFAENAGFKEVHLNFQVEIVPGGSSNDSPTDWGTFVRSAPNPLSPTLEEAMSEALTPEETKHFTAHLRPLFERAERISRDALAYLWAVK
jgi:arsenite methyltransferase